MAESVKFIHASDFHLDEPMKGLAELPPHLKSVIANAPYQAATRVFDLAISENVDFVLLAGDLFDLVSGGPRAAAFMLSQFERLSEHEIGVYWCAGTVDHPERWPNSIELPENVVTFSSSVVEEVTHLREGKPIATILGVGHDPRRRSSTDFIIESDAPFPIGLTHGDIDSSTLTAPNVRYWALGGRHKGSTLEKDFGLIVYPGTHQGRKPSESGAHGARLVRVDSNGKVRIQSCDIDTVRWSPQKIAITEGVRLDELKNVLGERALKIVSDVPDHQTVLVNWHLATSGSFNQTIRTPQWKKDLLDWLRDEFGQTEHGLWSVRITIEAPDALPAGCYEEDTILGDFLRAVGRYQSDDSLNLALHEYLPSTVEDDFASSMSRIDGKQRDRILEESSLLGIEYLAAGRDLSKQMNVEQI